jgi:hypothetical protein
MPLFGAAVGKASGVQIDRTVDLSNPSGSRLPGQNQSQGPMMHSPLCFGVALPAGFEPVLQP